MSKFYYLFNILSNVRTAASLIHYLYRSMNQPLIMEEILKPVRNKNNKRAK